jgi:predicted nucleic acid-binding protein
MASLRSSRRSLDSRVKGPPPFLENTSPIAARFARLRIPNPENPLDKQIAATALIHDLTVVTRNTDHFAPTGARLLNPFA